METVIEKLNNSVSHSKESIPITITGRILSKHGGSLATDGASGEFIERLEEPIKLDDSANYHVYLNDFTGWSNVPNVNESNRMFYYNLAKTPTIMEEIKFPISTQSIDTYNDFLQNVFEKRGHFIKDPSAKLEDDNAKKIFPVKFGYDLTIMRVIMYVDKGVIVTFKDDTWFRELGFDCIERGSLAGRSLATDVSRATDVAQGRSPRSASSLSVRGADPSASASMEQPIKGVYKEGVHLAPNMADVVKSLNILVRTNLSHGWRFKGKRTNILFNIINNVPPGQMITERPNPVKRVVLTNKNIEEIVLQFETEDGLPVDFNGEEFVLTLVIERM